MSDPDRHYNPDTRLVQKLAKLAAQKALAEMRSYRALLDLCEYEYDAVLHSLGWHAAEGNREAQEAIAERAVYIVGAELDAMIGGAR